MEAYSTGLRQQRDRLENLWRSVGDGMRMSHDTEVITLFKSTSEKIESCKIILYEEHPDLPKMILSENTCLPGTVRIETAVIKKAVIKKEISVTNVIHSSQ